MPISLQKLLLVFPAARRLREQLHNYNAEVKRLRTELQNSNTFLAEKSARLEQCLRRNAGQTLVTSESDLLSSKDSSAFEGLKIENARLLNQLTELQTAYKMSVDLNTELLKRAISEKPPAGNHG